MKKKTIFLIALLMAGLATFLFYQYTNQLTQTASTVEQMKTVFAAAVPIKKDQKITEDMLKQVEIPAKMVHQDAVLDAKKIIERDHYATTDIAVDEVILNHHLQVLEEAPSITGKFDEKHRAVTLTGGVVETLANMIEPEDTIDIMYTPQLQGADGTRKTIVLQKDVRVLAVGSRINTKDAFAEYDSVTVEATLEEALKYVNALKNGTLNYTLHSKRKTADTNTEGAS